MSDQQSQEKRTMRKLWDIDDGESHYVMAPTAQEALAFWRSDIGSDCDDEYVLITDITDMAEMMPIRSDDDAGGPPKCARMWMDEEIVEVALIGASVW